MIPVSDTNSALNSLDFAARPEDIRVVVAMSGGVDSSVVAGLLARQGYEVIGITLQLYDHGSAVGRKGACCGTLDIHDARAVADSLGIAHYVLDYEDRFRQSVIEDFADSYLAGETPIPCVMCNQTVKFADLLKTARDLGAHALATGHYIDSRRGSDGSKHREMFTAQDETRDQSYFLFTTTQEQLDYLRFPLGNLTKQETREQARKLGLSIADKPDSQDICFVPQGRYSDVIAKLRPNAARPGDIIHVDGRNLGRHEGVLNFTVGQRRGLKIATGEPLYVIALEADTARVIVGPREELLTHDLVLRDVNWLGGGNLSTLEGRSDNVYAKIRSTRPAVPARIAVKDGVMTVRLIDGDYGVSPGQACVFYDGQNPGARVLGGGWIRGTDKNLGSGDLFENRNTLTNTHDKSVILAE